ncbi:hypothetical protein ASPZODRAFT_32090, partial [Penicilliopsis zonata CBS 506.65]
PKTTTDSVAFEAVPYPRPVPSSVATPHPHITIDTVSTAHIPSLTRITGLLLPIRYPNSFYTATITDPVIASLSRVAVYHDHPVGGPAATTAATAITTTTTTTTTIPPPSLGADKVIGGIRCRLERCVQAEHTSTSPATATTLYIQTLHLLSPYRGHGVATALLNSLISAPDLVNHYNIRSVTAHVHEANEDGLKWYRARGFEVQPGVVEGYYRRLKPTGARIVKLSLEKSTTPATTATTTSTTTTTTTTTTTMTTSTAAAEDQDDEWEKVEAEEDDDHGIQPMDSRILDDERVCRKRKS